ncbi:hypothetical protein BUALT_Bualt08G0009300 [Buddleja alternifolia]|uniref:MULE transposase domain-containing protein n=1 Tax=Buddleja alternifolia TaxID=168488 RepID=A0AAV6X364_9LAMI|nr:hypothetical protein BUALT_Bualt08G0009300 [Buddleja alternifolia]
MQEDWYSDATEDDDLISLDESENENKYRGEQRRRHAYFREGDWNMKGRTLLKGMKFLNFKAKKSRKPNSIEEEGRGAMKNGFLAGCWSIIQLDRCFLKTLFGRQFLVAVGRDGNHNMVPIALAVVQVENLENWKWFLSVMLEDIGGLDQSHMWTFITDRKKGLLEAIAELAPYAEHRYCVRHMYENFKKKYNNIELKNLFWSASSSANRPNFEIYMERIERADPEVDDNSKTPSEWLRELPFQHWSRAFLRTTSKSGILVNNLSESFNNIILHARDKPIISMFECIITRLMSKIQKMREGMENYTGVICLNIRKRFGFRPPVFDKMYFSLAAITFKALLGQLCGYLCCHACATISERRFDVDDYVDDCFKKEAYLRVYEHMIHAVPGQKNYIKTNYPILRAPSIKRKRAAEEEPYEPVENNYEINTQLSAAPQPTQASQNDPSNQPVILGNTSTNSRPRLSEYLVVFRDKFWDKSAAPTVVGKKRKPSIADALKNIRERVQEKRPKQCRNSLWAKFMIWKIFGGNYPGSVEVCSGASLTWSRMCSVSNEVKQLIYWVLGVGKVFFWHDHWWGEYSLAELIGQPTEDNLKVKSLCQNGFWKISKLNNILPQHWVQDISSSMICADYSDVMKWKLTPNGYFKSLLSSNLNAKINFVANQLPVMGICSVL